MVSLIVATINRTAELERLLASLDKQTYNDFEVLIVDQNSDDRLVPLLAKHSNLKIRHFHSERGAARARNVALRVAVGDVIAFPDDDCWYPASVLESVVQWLEQHSNFDGVFTTVCSEDNQPVGPRWPPGSCLVTRSNLWNTTIFVNAFLRRSVTDRVGLFREDIGVGAATAYQSGEESDYFLRALAIDFRLWYEPTLTVYHPVLHGIDRLRSNTYGYALGAGYVWRIHGYSMIDLTGYVGRSLGGAIVSLGKGDVSMSHVYLLRAAGQVRGYLWGPRDLGAQVDPR
jgi:glycosyltransferase involved in cell wall biosynthesis